VCFRERERDWALSKQSIFLQRISEKVAFISFELVPFEQRNSEEKKIRFCKDMIEKFPSKVSS
jgi:hypothetical protein